MQRFAIFLLFACVFIGWMMPADLRNQAPPGAAGESALMVSKSAPSKAQVISSEGTITLERQRDGHFYAEAQVNGAPVRFLVDTGATSIALTHEDARRAAVPLEVGAADLIGKGAGGELHGQFVTLDRVSLGHKEVRGTSAAVVNGGEMSLLGQSFLAQFALVSIEGDRMVLR